MICLQLQETNSKRTSLQTLAFASGSMTTADTRWLLCSHVNITSFFFLLFFLLFFFLFLLKKARDL